MQEGLVITTDKEKIMDDTKVDEGVSEVNGMKSFKVVVKRIKEEYATMIVDAEDLERAEFAFGEWGYEILTEEEEKRPPSNPVWCGDMQMGWDLTEVDELSEKERELPRFTYD